MRYSGIKRERKEERTMLRYKGGHKVGKGTYWNFGTGDRIDISDEGILPGDRKAVYFRMPATGILVFGPIMGLLYAIFLPFIGIAMLVKLVIQKVVGEVSLSTRSAASFGWRPSESYLAGKKNGEQKEAEAEPDKYTDKE